MAKIARNATSAVTGGPYPNYDSDGTNKFIPAIWSGLLVEKTYPATVTGDVANTDYQGEISGFGDTVHIRTTPDVTVTPYEIGQKLNYEVLESPSTVLEINKSLSFSFAIDSIDKYQSDIDLITDFAQDASYQMATQVDVDFLATVPADAADGPGGAALGANYGNTAGAISENIVLGDAGTPLALTAANVVDWVVDLGLVFDERNVPRDGKRCLTVPNSVAALIKRSELRDASLAGDAVSISRNGLIGEIDSFMIYRSNLLSGDNTAGFNVLASHKSATTFAAQINDGTLKHLDNWETHGELIRGLMVYGYKVLKPDHIAWSVVTVA